MTAIRVEKYCVIPPENFMNSSSSNPPPLPNISLLKPPSEPPPLPKKGASAAPPPLPRDPISAAPPPAVHPAASKAQPQPLPLNVNKSNAKTFVIVGVAVIAIAAVTAAGFMWRARAEDQAHIAAIMADKLRMEEQVREIEIARLQEEELREKTESERMQAEAERDQLLAEAEAEAEADDASEAPTLEDAPRGITLDSSKWTAATAHLLLSDVVSKQEGDRRTLISKHLDKKDAAAEARIATLQAPRLLIAAGVESGTVMPSLVLIQQAALSSTDANALESALSTIDSLPKPARGDRKAARSANDEGLRLMQTHQYEDAVIAFNRALASDPADVEVLGNLSYAYLKNGQLSETLKISSYAVRIAPRRAGAWNQIAAAHALRGADWLAVRAYVTLYALSADQDKTREFLARAAADNNDESVREAARITLLVLPEVIAR